MRKRVLIIGPEGSGKKRIVQLLERKSDLSFRSSVTYYSETIVVPSAYLRSQGMLQHIIATQQKADSILMLLPSSRQFRVYSPNFANVFRIPVLGIIVHQKEGDLECLEDCRKELVEAGVDSIYQVDLNQSEQCQELLATVNVIRKGQE
ncbi:EutP/PduV family microcompartment system protein [Streptococcus merionis]|uniref:Putative EutP/PduV family GTP-binding protein n=1 Tax=Streptococcus merionis TaxID=400065 RepID=A0A239SZS9_9STRE|nr:EutP/PduV family microcompartment system protein [Streptococcus merionis]SNU90947.1 putative EutP/PduV family GTP-binding protein [Streptococcus merionis]